MESPCSESGGELPAGCQAPALLAPHAGSDDALSGGLQPMMSMLILRKRLDRSLGQCGILRSAANLEPRHQLLSSDLNARLEVVPCRQLVELLTFAEEPCQGQP